MSPKAPTSSKRRPAPKTPQKEKPALPATPQDDFLIAAIGASAGGMEAFKELMRNLPADTGIGFIVIQHLDPNHESALAELLSKSTSMQVTEVTDGMRVVPNQVFVIPPNTFMTISDHTLHLAPRGDARGVHMSVDQFMRSLAEHQGNRSIGVILSGSGTDGTHGLAEIQAQGGVTFAQEESSARYDGMPHSAIAAGFVDYVLPPKEIAKELARIARHPYISRDAAALSPSFPVEENNGLNSIFQLLRRSTGVDFTHYRKTTILRRIQRRMMVHKIERINDYVRYLQTNPGEINALYQDMLINVTSFFRNPKVFDALKTIVFPSLMKNRGQDGNIRVWTPGCASGEEIYSVAIALLEFLGDKVTHTNIQFFGTDVSEANILKARAGAYPENIQGDVSPERLRRFFSKTENGYRISKSIRDMCIFARHNLINDPPFSQMDLICCRNLLIYLEPVLQSKIISLFHYAIRGNGFLVLGTSEGVGTAGNLFAGEDRALKIFSKKPGAGRQLVTFSLSHATDRGEGIPAPLPPKSVDIASNHVEVQREFDRRLLTTFSPASAFINDDFEVIHTRGNITRYLKLAPGRATLNILKMAREGLLFDLRNAMNRSKKDKVSVRKQKVQVRIGNGNGHGEAHTDVPASRLVDFEVVPITIGSFKDLYFMVVFQDSPEPGVRASGSARVQRESDLNLRQLEKLQQELESTKEYLQSVIETQEATNEELQSANEEILSSNEELQSTNEELETTKEELQSTNEELITVNDELRARNIEVTQINNDLTNLLSSIEIAVVMVSGELSIRRFTPKAQKLFGLIVGDVGRPLWNINPSLEIPNFQQAILDVISNEKPVERHLTGREGQHYQLRILPYRTAEGAVDGAVITLMPPPQETKQ
ncbi:MAG TPA: chemotaxis protein CheB [Candidatus Acidoferrales bacterium]|jgi:two-component system CheB/CheR fusion protein|nr:chemotaxis protein CheB [Candidatus Acidoferrales bacterium]